MNLLRFKLIKPQFWLQEFVSLFLYPFSLIYYLFSTKKKSCEFI